MQIIIRSFLLSAQFLEIAPDLGFSVGRNALAFDRLGRLLHGPLEGTPDLGSRYFLEGSAARKPSDELLPFGIHDTLLACIRVDAVGLLADRPNTAWTAPFAHAILVAIRV